MSQLNVNLPIRTSNAVPESAARQAAITSITSFYTLLTRLPYIPPSALMLPPIGGWQSIDESELRRRGKSDSVISVLRELPYLNAESEWYTSQWTLAFSTLHINYAKGEMYQSYYENELLPVPSHVIWLSFGYERAGCFWLLDTQTWEIVEYTLMGDSLETAWDVYETVPDSEKWKHYSRMPADKYFDLWRWRYESLEFMIVRENSPGFRMDHWHAKDPMLLWEESLEETDDEDEDFVPLSTEEEADEVSAMSDDSSDEESEIEDMEWDMVEDINELNDLMEDAAGMHATQSDNTQEVRMCSLTQMYDDGTSSYGKSTLFLNDRTHTQHGPNPEIWNTPQRVRQREEMKELLQICHKNGWPKHEQRKIVAYVREVMPPTRILELDNFNREKCVRELNELMRSRRRKARERTVRKATEMMSGFKRDVLMARHKLQRGLLTSEGPVDDAKLHELSLLLDSIEPVKHSDDEILLDTKIHKVLIAIVKLPWLQADDRHGVHRKAKEIVDFWIERGMEEE